MTCLLLPHSHTSIHLRVVGHLPCPSEVPLPQPTSFAVSTSLGAATLPCGGGRPPFGTFALPNFVLQIAVWFTYD
jgi:hypothetical protein